MSTRATITFEIESWDEKPYEEFEGGRKISRASIRKSFRGDVEGQGALEYLMAYAEDGSAGFVGMERIVGSLGDRSGSFVLQHTGTYDEGISKGSLLVVPGSATEELDGLRGEGRFAFAHAQEYVFTLDYHFV